MICLFFSCSLVVFLIDGPRICKVLILVYAGLLSYSNEMANPPNVELEAAKFLHKLIQESTDEPTKLATKLYVVCLNFFCILLDYNSFLYACIHDIIYG